MFNALRILEKKSNIEPFFSASELEQYLPEKFSQIMADVDAFIAKNIPDVQRTEDVLMAFSKLRWDKSFSNFKSFHVPNVADNKGVIAQAWVDANGSFTVSVAPCQYSGVMPIMTPDQTQKIEISFNVSDGGISSIGFSLFKAQEQNPAYAQDVKAQKRDAIAALSLVKYIEQGNYVDMEKIRSGCFTKDHHMDAEVSLTRSLEKYKVPVLVLSSSKKVGAKNKSLPSPKL